MRNEELRQYKAALWALACAAIPQALRVTRLAMANYDASAEISTATDTLTGDLLIFACRVRPADAVRSGRELMVS